MESGPSASGVLVVARRYSAQGVEELREGVPLEEPLAVEIEGELAAVLMRTPGAEKALALGYCLSEGLIRSLGDVLLLHHCRSGAEEGMVLPGAHGEGPLGGRNRVRLRLTPAAAA
ncbi:MAG: formate dehydrogenase accessory sulfurtransferase FdhD, partial [Thiobacillaceae bacterium]